MQKLFLIYLYIFLLTLSLHSEDLTSKYKNMMGSENNNLTKSIKQIKKSTENKLYDAIKNLQQMKKSTFESTNDFESRRKKQVLALEDEERFFIVNGDRQYSAGTATMKGYNPDTEIMVLNMKWDKNILSILPEGDNFSNVSFYIGREEAKKLFKNKKSHFFHIQFKYINNKLKISKIFLYDQYKLYENINSQISIVKNTTDNHVPTNETCTNYRVIANQLNIRNAPQIHGNVLGQINKNETICIDSFENNWGKSKYGWISKKYLVSEKDFLKTHSSNHGSALNTDTEEVSSDLPIFVKIILSLIAISLLFTYWRYAIGFIFIIIAYQIFFK